MSRGQMGGHFWSLAGQRWWAPDIQAEAHPPFPSSGGPQSPAFSLLGRKHSEQVTTLKFQRETLQKGQPGQPVSEVKEHHSRA